MLYLFWGLLNIGLLIWLFSLCYTITKSIRERSGIVAALLFVLLLLGFVGSQGRQRGNNDQKRWDFNSRENILPNSEGSVYVTLQKTPVSKYELQVFYGKEKESQSMTPFSAMAFNFGFIVGTKWEVNNISITRVNSSDSIAYTVDAGIKWKLLGIELFSQRKSYSGFASMK